MSLYYIVFIDCNYEIMFCYVLVNEQNSSLLHSFAYTNQTNIATWLAIDFLYFELFSGAFVWVCIICTWAPKRVPSSIRFAHICLLCMSNYSKEMQRKLAHLDEDLVVQLSEIETKPNPIQNISTKHNLRLNYCIIIIYYFRIKTQNWRIKTIPHHKRHAEY